MPLANVGLRLPPPKTGDSMNDDPAHLSMEVFAMPRYTLETIILVLILLWLLGWLVVPGLGSLVHILLVVILIVVVIRLFQGRSPLP